MDLGIVEGYDWAHSPRKLELAERLAKLALAKEYGVGKLIDAVSPRPIGAKLSDDKSEIVIDFTDLGTGLIAKGQDPKQSVGLPHRLSGRDRLIRLSARATEEVPGTDGLMRQMFCLGNQV